MVIFVLTSQYNFWLPLSTFYNRPFRLIRF